MRPIICEYHASLSGAGLGVYPLRLVGSPPNYMMCRKLEGIFIYLIFFLEISLSRFSWPIAAMPAYSSANYTSLSFCRLALPARCRWWGVALKKALNCMRPEEISRTPNLFPRCPNACSASPELHTSMPPTCPYTRSTPPELRIS